MPYFNLEAIRAAPVATEPFSFFLASGVLDQTFAGDIDRDYPIIDNAGSYSVADAAPGPSLKRLIDEIQSDEFRDLIAEKFGLDLTGRAVLVTLRGRCAPKDGRIHTDSKSKIVTVLLYLNNDWDVNEGMLRLLRRGDDIESTIVEVPPTFGSMVAFRRSDASFHGHKPFEGPRRVLQLNYLVSSKDSMVGTLRHRLSSFFKAFAFRQRTVAPSSDANVQEADAGPETPLAALVAASEFDGLDGQEEGEGLVGLIEAAVASLALMPRAWAQPIDGRAAVSGVPELATGDLAPSVWYVTSGNAGSRSQARGLALALAPDAQEKIVAIPKICAWLPTLAASRLAMAISGSRGLGPPWPNVLITCGRRSAAVSLAVRRLSAGTLTVHIERPPVSSTRFDLVVAMPHDGMRGDGVMLVDTALHPVTKEALAAAAVDWEPRLGHLPRPWVGVALGGSTQGRPFTRDQAHRLIGHLDRLRREGSVLITPSRRTPDAILELLAQRYRDDPRAFLWLREGDNPYLAIIGMSDSLVVTSDSISMMSEALSGPAQVLAFDVGGGRRHRAFLHGLAAKGLVGVLGQSVPLERGPLNATAAAAHRVRTLLAQPGRRGSRARSTA